MMKSKKYILEIIVAIILIVTGVITLLLPFMGITNCKAVLIFTYGLITIVNLVWFILVPRDKDKESLYSFLASFIVFILSIVLKSTASNLALILLLYVMLLSLIRLKKADFYHDRRNKIWQINIICLALLILVGLLTSVNLYYQSSVQILMFGYFFLINGILELVDPLVLYLKG